ncbi:MDM1 protein, partial [Furnarius figulus]|nr:MDM1 protein [Furnarius figulus]
LGIAREPKFISNFFLPYFFSQISKSFEWTAVFFSNDFFETEATKLHTDHNNNDVNQEEIEMPEEPRLPFFFQSFFLDSNGETALALVFFNMNFFPSEVSPNQNEEFFFPKIFLEKMGNGLHFFFQRKAHVNISRFFFFPSFFEYQSQFVWKSPFFLSPIFLAEQ